MSTARSPFILRSGTKEFSKSEERARAKYLRELSESETYMVSGGTDDHESAPEFTNEHGGDSSPDGPGQNNSSNNN